MMKFTSKVEYNVLKHEDIFTGKSHIAFRYLDLTITADTAEIAEAIWLECVEYLEKNFGRINVVGCPSSDPIGNKGKYYYFDSIVVYDKDEYEDLKDLIKDWKSSRKLKVA